MKFFKKLFKWITSKDNNPKLPPEPLNFKIIRELFKNRLQRYSLCADNNFREQKEKEAMVTHEEMVLGSKERVIELGQRFITFENDEVFLQDSLTYFFIHKKMNVKNEYSFEEVVLIIKEAMAERNLFLKECEAQLNEEYERITISPL